MKNPTQLFFFLLILSMVALVKAQEVDDEAEFNYEKGSEKGPEHWGELKKEWEMCNKGKLQSPIDLLHQRVQKMPKYEKIVMSYNPTKTILKNRGHDIEMKFEGGNSSIEINGTNYVLTQAHWHSPSEHTINGRRFAMELHMVHQSKEGSIAVIGTLFDIGRPDPFLQKMMKQMESVSHSLAEMEIGAINPKEINNVGGCQYYRYMGSLTTPPCTEGVLWTVNKKIATVSKEQLAQLRDAVHDSVEANSRPLQLSNGRKVKLYADETKGVSKNTQ